MFTIVIFIIVFIIFIFIFIAIAIAIVVWTVMLCHAVWGKTQSIRQTPRSQPPSLSSGTLWLAPASPSSATSPPTAPKWRWGSQQHWLWTAFKGNTEWRCKLAWKCRKWANVFIFFICGLCIYAGFGLSLVYLCSRSTFFALNWISFGGGHSAQKGRLVTYSAWMPHLPDIH